MSLKDKINYKCLPKHVAIIMDGNGRWAKCHGKDRLFGHQNGVESVREVTEASVELGIKYLTLYAFSTENWNRPQDEVEGLMHLMIQAIENETPTLMKNNVRVEVIGDIEKIDQETRDAIDRVTEMSKNNDALTLIIALSYSSRWEIEKAVRDIAIGVKNNEIEIEDINQEMISNHLCTKNFPDPDLLIRTSGEYRISNFLMWQLSYAELYFTPTFWPDFKKENYYEAILDFQSRERRFGKTSEQINK
ncbi:MAG: isoprenyl transferase [Bacteroidales bacterium]|nr:isoprenyl transferase [Bacteroidales bacterium]MDD4685198.1 isoprenyl transferase [Bacteroidales bacterium]